MTEFNPFASNISNVGDIPCEKEDEYPFVSVKHLVEAKCEIDSEDEMDESESKYYESGGLNNGFYICNNEDFGSGLTF